MITTKPYRHEYSHNRRLWEGCFCSFKFVNVSFALSYNREFAKSFDYVGKEVDEALRQFQSYFKLTVSVRIVVKLSALPE